MIDFYTGTLGTGKSFHTAKRIYEALSKGVNVISNLDIDITKIKPKRGYSLGAFVFVPNSELLANSYKLIDGNNSRYKPFTEYSYINGLIGFAEQFHVRDKHDRMYEHQTLLIYDECQELWNPRTWNRKDRLAWIEFFRECRHYGFDVLMISQDSKSVDKQIVCTSRYETEHRNVKDYKILGKFLSLLFGGQLFICIELYTAKKKTSRKQARNKSYYLVGDKKFFEIYNSGVRYKSVVNG